MDLVVMVGLALIAAVPVVATLVALAGWLEPRLVPVDRLATAIASVPDPAAEGARLRRVARLLTTAWCVYAGVLVVLGVVELFGPAEGFMVLIVAPFAALGLGCTVLLVGRVPPVHDGPPPRPARAADLVPARLLAVLAVSTGLIVAGFLAAGLVSTTDPVSTRHLAVDLPSIVDWEVAGGQIVNVVYAPGMVTAPWPGWAWSGPALAGALVAWASVQAVVTRLTGAGGGFGSGRPVVTDALRRQVGTVVGLLVLATFAFVAGPAAFIAGTALVSASLLPQPAPDELNISVTLGHTEPLHAAGILLQYGGAAMALAGVTLAVVALFGARSVDRARRAIQLVSTGRDVATLSRPTGRRSS